MDFTRYAEYMNAVREEGARALKFARENNKRIMILAGKTLPYRHGNRAWH